MKIHKNLLKTAGLLLIPAAVFAEEQVSEKTLLDAVVVTASRTEETVFAAPSFVISLDQQRIDEAQPRTLRDVLVDLPNVEFSDAAGSIWQRPSIRGVGENGIVFLIDGAR